MKGKSEPPAENGGEEVEEVEEGDGSEYEIEQVLDAKRGVFPDVRALFVSKFFHTESARSKPGSYGILREVERLWT
jgi:hypothetical protein